MLLEFRPITLSLIFFPLLSLIQDKISKAAYVPQEGTTRPSNPPRLPRIAEVIPSNQVIPDKIMSPRFSQVQRVISLKG